MEIDITQILRGVNDKDEKAWKTVFIYYYAALCSYADRVINNTIISEDLVQDVLLNIWKSDRKFQQVNDLTYYLYRATYNQAMMYLRHEKYQECYVRQAHQEEVEFTDEEFAETVREELVRQMYFYIDDLPEERRKIILLSIKGYSGNQIAEELGITINTVKTQKSRSFRYLREKLKDSANMFWLTVFLSSHKKSFR